MKANKLSKGFTLIEMLIYIAVFSMIVIVTIQTVILSVDTFVQIRANRNILESGSVTMEAITRGLKEASSVDASNSVFSSDSGVLILNNTGGAVTTRSFSNTGGQVILSEDGTDVGPLTTSDINVDALVFNQITTSAGEAIKITLTLSDQSPAGLSETFYNTILLRGAY